MDTMKITRHLHACVEINHHGYTLIIDPGSFGVPESLASADAVLITHGHPDHLDQQALLRAHRTNPGMVIYAPAFLADELPVEAHAVDHGQSFTIGGIPIEVVGSKHAMITHTQDVPENIGYLIGGRILHPGDNFQPIRDVDVALVPVNGPWVKMLDVEAWLKKFPPKHFVGIHDGIVNEHGLAMNTKILTLLADKYGSTYLPLAPGDSLDLGV